jgi:hypothetical protein
VVITVDGLPEDVRTIHRESPQAGWWLIGALLARSLAEFHNDAGARDAFGVVVPYRAQEEATQAALDDSALAMATPVGTSHKFQGRQFDTVLADLVEDGRGRMARADLRGGDYSADSVRLFNVAATRPRSRLYVLVGRGALEQARNGPLAALQSMVSAGRACRVDPTRCSACSIPNLHRLTLQRRTWWRRSIPTYASPTCMTRTPPSTRRSPGSTKRARASGAGAPG